MRWPRGKPDIRFLLGAPLLVSAGIFFHLIAADPLLERDDQHILAHAHDGSEMLSMLAHGQIAQVIGLQPVRDLLVRGEGAFLARTGWSIYHLTSWVLWFGIVAVVYTLLRELIKKPRLALALAACFALHPVYVGSIAWVAAQKHLLSCLFIFAATVIVVRFQAGNSGETSRGNSPEGLPRSRATRATLGVTALYVLSVLSHPIAVLWPLWALTYCLCIPKNERRPGLLRLPLACLPWLLIGGAANLYYYAYAYPLFTSAQKWVPVGGAEGGGIALLALGRYFFNLFCPIRLAAVYYPGSLVNLWGLAGGFAFCAWVFARVPWRQALPWLAFFLFSLLPVTLRPTQVFVSDTYVLTASLGFWVSLGLLLETPAGRRFKRHGVFYFCALLLGFAWLSCRQASHWESDRALWASTFATEPSPRSLVLNARFLLAQGQYEEVRTQALRLRAWDPSDPDFAPLFGRAVYLDSALSNQEKKQTLAAASRAQPDPWLNYFEASVEAADGHMSEADVLMSEALKNPARFAADLPIVAAEAEYLCRQSHRPHCEAIVERARAAPLWREAAYSARFAELLQKPIEHR